MHLRASIKQKNLCQSTCSAVRERLGNQSHHSLQGHILWTAKLILSAGWDSDARTQTILNVYYHICSDVIHTGRKFHKFLMQILDKVYSNKSLIFELLLDGNHLLSITCQGLYHYSQHFPPIQMPTGLHHTNMDYFSPGLFLQQLIKTKEVCTGLKGSCPINLTAGTSSFSNRTEG